MKIPRGLLILALMAGSANAVEINGFKDFKFGMSRQQIENLGFEDCTKKTYSCSLSSSEHTIIGQKTSYISVDFDDKGFADKVTVNYPKPPLEAIADFTQALGEPKEYEFINFGGSRVFGSAWVSDSQNGAIRISYVDGEGEGSLTRNILGKVVTDKTTFVKFISGEDLASLLKQIKESNKAIDGNDI
jgi:hypothetical protein